MRPTPPVRGRCPEGAEGVGIIGPYENAGSIHAGGHMGPPLQKNRNPFSLAHNVRTYGNARDDEMFELRQRSMIFCM